MSVRVLYFASLRDAAGCESEAIEGPHSSLGALYDDLARRYGFRFPRDRVRAARNGAFAPWDAIAADGDEIAFLPPVSGG
jgi:molybdopterin synthase sulfur carrier subunit